MLIDEDYKNVIVSTIESHSEDESTQISPTHAAQLDICSYFLYISCHFLTFTDTRMIVLPAGVIQLYASQPIIYSANESFQECDFF